MNHDPRVCAEITHRLAGRGRLTFAEVMEIALYHPDGGYYAAHVRLGPDGDFVTSPEEHPAFGALLARQAAQCWALMGRPAAFLVAEMGGGRGTLAAAFLEHALQRLPDFAGALRYHLVDRSPRLLAEQRARLAPFGDRVGWSAALPSAVEGLILSNELVDAFPVHRVVMREGALGEIYVVAAPGSEAGLAFHEGPPSTPELAGHFDRLGIALAEGQQAEVSLAAIGWMREVARALSRGFVITIDFGHLAPHLYSAERPRGTLLAYHRQRVSDDLLARLGLQDLIAHVDFSTLVEVGREEGLEPLGLVTQQNLLLDLGLEGWLDAINDLPLDLRCRAANRRALVELVRNGENALGDAKVLVQARGMSGELDGLRPAARRRNAALLRAVPMPML